MVTASALAAGVDDAGATEGCLVGLWAGAGAGGVAGLTAEMFMESPLPVYRLGGDIPRRNVKKSAGRCFFYKTLFDLE
jgi:hypothetical protein